MFKRYGLIGILLIIFVQVNFFFKVQPFADWYFPIVWIGYILTIDALIYKLKKSSLLLTQPIELISLILVSVPIWFVFEFLNTFTVNWYYTTEYTSLLRLVTCPIGLIAFYETFLLVRTVKLFDKAKLKSKHKISKSFLYFMIFTGIVCFITPILLPKYTYPLIWLSFFLILDPINYLHKQPSIIGHLKDRKLATPLSLLLAGLVMGFLWEFWNHLATAKWIYDVPFLGFFKVFGMPILGYLGYLPFAFELYAMYWFARSLFTRKKSLSEWLA